MPHTLTLPALSSSSPTGREETTLRILSTHPTLRLIACETTDNAILGDVINGVHAPISPWPARVAEPRFHVVLAAQYGRVIGFIALDASSGHMDIVDMYVAPAAENRSIIVDALVDVAIDLADTAWGNISLDATSLALDSLLRDGWTPTTHDSQHRLDRLELTGAGVQ